LADKSTLFNFKVIVQTSRSLDQSTLLLQDKTSMLM